MHERTIGTGAVRRRLVVAHVIHSLGSGGAEELLLQLASVAPRVNIRLVVVGLSDAADNRSARALREAGVTVYELHSMRYDPSVAFRLMRILRAERCDVVHTHLKHADVVGSFAAERLRLPVVSTLHLIDSGAGVRAGAPRRLASFVRSRWMDGVVAISSAQASWYRGIDPRSRVVEIPNGVADPAPLRSREQVRRELGLHDDTKVLALTIALMRPEKGHALLLDAIRSIPTGEPIVFALAGDGPTLESIRSAVESDPLLAERVALLGYRTDIVDLLNAADLVVHPSLQDALPTALISAAACGKPIVATRVGGTPDIVTAGSGILVPPGDARVLGRAIREVGSNSALRHAMGAAARSRYEDRFTATSWAENLRSLYEQVLSGESRERGRSPTVKSAIVVSAVQPYPADNGKSVVVAGILRHLQQRLGSGGVSYLHVGPPLKPSSELDDIVVHELGSPRRSEQLLAVARMLVGRRGSLQESLLWSPSISRRIAQLRDEIGADLEVIDTVRISQLMPTSSARRVLYMDDLFSVRYERMLAVLDSDGYASDFDPLGQFSRFVPSRLRWMTSSGATRRLLLQFELSRVAETERRAAAEADVAVLLNNEEADFLRSITGAQVVTMPPTLVDQRPRVVEWDGSPEYLFIGLLSVAHNHDGLSWFLEQGMPKLLARRPDARLHIAGAGASPELHRLAARFGDSVVMHGFVEDLDEVMAGRCCLISPLRFGSGVKIKILEALARGLPVVATPVAAEGLGELEASGVVVVEDMSEAARALDDLARPDQRQPVARDALVTYYERFSADVAGRSYDAVFGTRAPIPAGIRGH